MYFISKLTKRFLVLSAINFLLIHNIFSDERKLLILGDSISAGYGIEEGNQWTEILQIKYNEQKTELVIINASISGDTTGGGLSRIESLLNKNKWLKKYVKMLRFLKGTNMVTKAAAGATYKTVWVAGPTIEHTTSIEPLQKIIQRFI